MILFKLVASIKRKNRNSIKKIFNKRGSYIMPEWLLKKDNYILQKDKDTFINKSILSILEILARFRIQTEYKSNKFGINTIIKVIITLIINYSCFNFKKLLLF